MDALTYITVDDTGAPDEHTSGVSVHAGFPNPAAERSAQPLSLDRLLVRSPCSTYFMRVRGHSWRRLGVFDGDIAVVDRALTPTPHAVVVSTTEAGELVLCKWDEAAATETGLQSMWGTLTAIVHPFAAAGKLGA